MKLAWVWPMREGGTNQPAPIVYNGTLYLANTGGVVQDLEAQTGKLIWEHRVGADVAPRVGQAAQLAVERFALFA